MSTEQQLQLIGEAYRAIASMFPNFRPRPQQQAMMRRAARLLTANDIQDAPSIGMIDAPTGTGKSLGYLLPGLIAAATDDRRLILSTATASLQDQLAVKDVPMVLRALEQVGLSGISFAIAKGRERHVCPLRLEAQTTNQSLFSGTEDFQMMRDEFDGGWNGLKDTLRTPIKANAWRMVNNTASSSVSRSRSSLCLSSMRAALCLAVCASCKAFNSAEEGPAIRLTMSLTIGKQDSFAMFGYVRLLYLAIGAEVPNRRPVEWVREFDGKLKLSGAKFGKGFPIIED